MATNGPKGGGRRGAVTGRSQLKNPRTDLWTKRGSANGQFMDNKTSSANRFKGVRRER